MGRKDNLQPIDAHTNRFVLLSKRLWGGAVPTWWHLPLHGCTITDLDSHLYKSGCNLMCSASRATTTQNTKHTPLMAQLGLMVMLAQAPPAACLIRFCGMVSH